MASTTQVTTTATTAPVTAAAAPAPLKAIPCSIATPELTKVCATNYGPGFCCAKFYVIQDLGRVFKNYTPEQVAIS